MADGAVLVIVGIGNWMRGDDAVGPAVAARLRVQVPDWVRVVESDGEPGTLMEHWAAATSAILVDAISSQQEPGWVLRIDASEEPIPARYFRHSTHLFALSEAVELARSLGRLPESVVVYGVEASGFRFGEPMSGPVAEAVDEVVDRIMEEIGARGLAGA